jgi:4-amino-4-deoxy-L-arabinose transferase-like glycosyltransferase
VSLWISFGRKADATRRRRNRSTNRDAIVSATQLNLQDDYWRMNLAHRLPRQQTKAAALCGIALIPLFIFCLQGLLFIRANSQTFDEATHLVAGYSYLVTGDFRLDSEHPPLVKQLQALPLFVGYELPFNTDAEYWRQRGDYLLGYDFLYGAPIPADRLLGLSRLINLSIGCILIVVVGWWTYRLWGAAAALAAMSLACFDPNLVAHSSLVTTDVGVTLFTLLSVYLLWEYLRRPRWWLLAATGISAGLALVTKFSALLLLPLLGLIVMAAAFLPGCNFLPWQADTNWARRKYLHGAIILAAIFFVAMLMIPPAYFFQGYGPWLSGLERFRSLADAGRLAFFLGEYSYQGWWSYYLVSLAIKTPVGTLLLIAGSLILHRSGSPLKRREAIFLVLPVIFILLAMTQSKVNIGLRHILPVYPFIFILAGRLATVSYQRRWLSPLLVGAPLLWTAISALQITPHQLAYFNEFVGGPERGYRYLSDSNLDWGQDLKGLRAYMAKENLPIIYLSYFGTAPPAYYGIRYQFVPGTWPLVLPPPVDKVPAAAPRKILAISVYNLQDVSTAYYPLFRWLLNRQPVAKIGYSIFLYDLTHDPEGLSMLEESYVRAGILRPSGND